MPLLSRVTQAALTMANVMERIECLVVGAGVIGMATARVLALRGREVCFD